MTNATFVQEFNSISSHLRGFAMKLTRDLSQAEDLFQETALRAFRYQSKYESNTNLKAWLSTMMRNLFINDYRKHKKQQENKEAKEIYYQNFLGASASNAGELGVDIREIEGVINDLDDMYRVPFLLFYEGYKYDEIQKTLAPVPLGTIKSRIHIARKILKKKLVALDIVSAV